jgi:xylulokinase
MLETCREAGAEPIRVLAVGGGTKNGVWMQATSDLARIPQIVCEKTVGASYGDAFLAAVATGAVGPDDIAAWNPAARTVSPDDVPVYTRQYPLWRALYEQTRDIAHALGD